jgi:hypothetical protein
MIPERLRTSEQEIRRSVARRQYAELPRRLDDLHRIADELIAGLPGSDPLRLEIIGFVLATIEWARLMLATQREVWSGQLGLLPRVGRYLDRPDCRTQAMCVDL